jgi:hypothetical protein
MNMVYILTDNGAIVFEVHECLHITEKFSRTCYSTSQRILKAFEEACATLDILLDCLY